MHLSWGFSNEHPLYKFVVFSDSLWQHTLISIPQQLYIYVDFSDPMAM